VALADFSAAGDRLVTLEERHQDLRRRYGPSAFLDESLARAQGLRAEFERTAGTAFRDVVGL
jgi:hypothetical protein